MDALNTNMLGRSTANGSALPAGKTPGRSPDGMDPFGASVRDLLRYVIARARVEGVSRDEICERLRRASGTPSVRTLEGWLSPERRTFLPADHLVRMLVLNVLPEKVRDELWDSIAAAGGKLVVDLADVGVDADPIEEQMLDVTAALGAAAAMLREAMADGSLSDAERWELAEAMRGLAVETAELTETLMRPTAVFETHPNQQRMPFGGGA